MGKNGLLYRLQRRLLLGAKAGTMVAVAFQGLGRLAEAATTAADAAKLASLDPDYHALANLVRPGSWHQFRCLTARCSMTNVATQAGIW